MFANHIIYHPGRGFWSLGTNQIGGQMLTVFFLSVDNKNALYQDGSGS